jgi:ABC-type multidrug transport system ATPase subunit
MLKLLDLVMHHRCQDEEVYAFGRVRLDIEVGELFALHGPNGSGRTTEP